MTVIEEFRFAGDLVLHGTAQAATLKEDLTHRSSSRTSTQAAVHTRAVNRHQTTHEYSLCAGRGAFSVSTKGVLEGSLCGESTVACDCPLLARETTDPAALGVDPVNSGPKYWTSALILDTESGRTDASR